MTPRSLVGMTMGARKRAWLAGRIDSMVFPDGIHTDELEMKSAYSWSEIRRWWQPFGWQLLGQRLRPCPGCSVCAHPCHYCEMQEPNDSRCPRCRQVMYSTPICDGSGVIKAGPTVSVIRTEIEKVEE